MPSNSRTTVGALIGMTFVTGLIDAASVLGLGHVFVANMTGNIVFIGFSLFTQGGVSLGAAALALAFFLLGATLGGRMIKREARGQRPALILEVGLLLAAGLGAMSWGTARSWLLIVPLATAMGVRTAAVRALGVPDLTTTVLTLTVTGIAADSSLAGGSNPRLARRLMAVAAMLAGASLGALLVTRAAAYVLLIAALLEAAAVAVLLRSLHMPEAASSAT